MCVCDSNGNFLKLILLITHKTHITHIYIFELERQSVRASERNSVIAGSNPTQANFL